jgi:uncharacterized protein
LRLRRKLLVLCFLVSVVLPMDAAEAPIPPVPTRWVTDTANFISPETVRVLDDRLSAYERGTGHQILVYIGTTTGDAPIEDWAVRAFEAWKVGRRGIDDGLVLFIMSQDRRLRIEVGYGLEGEVPDAIASRVINEVIVPRIQQGDPDGAVTAGIEALVGVIGGQSVFAQPGPQGAVPGQLRPITIGQLILYGIIGIILLIFVITNPSLAFYLLASILSSGHRRGGGGGFGGGFGGRGGGFGGGVAAREGEEPADRGDDPE